MAKNLLAVLKESWGIGVLIIFYSVGLVGSVFFDEGLMRLTPLNLLLSISILIFYHRARNRNFWLYSSIVFIGGFLIEWLGVSTGIIFGRYHYGENLGIKLFDIPLIIGINWLILSYCSMSVVEKYRERWSLNLSPIASASIGSLLMVFVDFWIERLCARLDFWYWKSSTAPLQNYIAWFVFAFAFNYLLVSFRVETKNKTAVVLYLLQVVFFLLLNVLL